MYLYLIIGSNLKCIILERERERERERKRERERDRES